MKTVCKTAQKYTGVHIIVSLISSGLLHSKNKTIQCVIFRKLEHFVMKQHIDNRTICSLVNI